MGVIAAAVRHLIAAGMTGDDLVRAIEDMEAEARGFVVAPEYEDPDDRRRAKGAARTRLYRQRLGDPVPEEMRQLIFARDGYACVDCGAVDRLEIDHIHPVSKGGDSSEGNLQTLCRPCNARKRDRIRKREIRDNSEECPSNSGRVRNLSANSTDISMEIQDTDGQIPSPDKSPQTPKINPTPQAHTRTREGTRLPDGWTLPDDWREFAANERKWSDPEITSESEQFRDYWLGKPGKDGRKADWPATWRNWVRRSRRQAVANGGGGGSGFNFGTTRGPGPSSAAADRDALYRIAAIPVARGGSG